MKQYQSAIESNQYYQDMEYPYFDNRIDCLYIKRYYQIDDNTFDMISIFNPTQYGIETIKERYNSMNSLSQKIAAKKASASSIDNPLNANNASLQSRIADKKTIEKKQSLNDQSALNAQKFYEVSELKNKIEQYGIDIVNLNNTIAELSKVVYENNSLLAILSKDIKSNLNATNSLHGRFANIGNNANIKADNKGNNDQKVITRKAINTDSNVFLIDQNLNDESYQGFYEHFKSYFNHKFAKNSKCIHLDIFKTFCNPIDFQSLQSINDSCRISWQDYRTQTSEMIFAPGSMALAITSLIKTGKDFDLIKDYSPIIDKKAKPEVVKAINDEFADSSTHSDNNECKSEVKDFAYWSTLLNADISIIQECVSALKDKDDNTYPLIKEHLNANSKDIIDTDIDSFIDYLDNSSFAHKQ